MGHMRYSLSGIPSLGCILEVKVQSLGCFHGFHGSLLGHLVKKILKSPAFNVLRGLDVFKSVQLIPA